MAQFAFDPAKVRQALKESGVTREEFAKVVGLSHVSALDKIFSGQRKVKVDEAERMYDYLRLRPADSVDVRTVPIIGLAAAGNWREAIEMPLGKMMLPSHVAGARAFGVEVTGDSMNLLIEDGGWIVIDPDDKVLSAGKCYLIRNADHEVTVKRYQKGPARFEPVSDNDEHQAFEVADCDFVVMGRVVWKGAPV